MKDSSMINESRTVNHESFKDLSLEEKSMEADKQTIEDEDI